MDLTSPITASLLVVNKVVSQQIVPLDTQVVEKQIVKEKTPLPNLNDSAQLNKLKKGTVGQQEDKKKAKDKKPLLLEDNVQPIRPDIPARPGSHIDLKA